jgi:putative DNA primase/helicase
VSAPVENLVERLHAKRSGKGWIAKCPAHDDRKPSLSIDEGSDGRALLKCHAGCDNTAILASLGMKPRDLFPVTSHRQSDNGATSTSTAPFD